MVHTRAGARYGLGAAATAALTLVAGAWVGSSTAGATTIPTVRVKADTFRFCANYKADCVSADTNHRTRIKRGTRVIWIYNDDECDRNALCPGHNVKIGTRTASPTVKTDGAEIARMRFWTVGTFHYVCTHHKQLGMTGTIVVYRPTT